MKNSKRTFTYIWEYRVRDDCEPAFLGAYGPDGEWARLFSRAPGYIRTELLSDAADPHRFVTIDHWESKDDRDAFMKKFAVEFAEIDERCGSLTSEERFIGDFDSVG